MSLRNGRGGAGDHSSAPTNTNTSSAPQELTGRSKNTASADSAVVFGTRLRAVGDSRFDRILVRRCCWCGHPHLHIAFEGPEASIVRAPACARHRMYVVQVVDVVPGPEQRRTRGAA